ncbi:MAG: regulatory protein RecX [Pseudomonadota bacterium]|uniref:regulatory protein RecX n=1 Tax=Alcanivorax sp. TaxID=1872427 RepID=UPI002437BCBF|nr:regulatory protein RecX [Alcanivorax sp.]MED5239665.1 regulatory protein RecX [Pseudomonadota bacterium]MEE3321516.1 regulatory protein RecX [Pseudomonadota bacterium]
MNKPLTESELRQRAVSLLARRDHARRELETKLRSKVGEHPALASVIQWCEEQGFIDDRRFAGFFVRSRIERGHGPLRIRQEMQLKGVDRELIEAAIRDAGEDSGIDWFALARDARARRFRSYPQDQKEKARQLRFLQSRGFDAEQSFAALDVREEE